MSTNDQVKIMIFQKVRNDILPEREGNTSVVCIVPLQCQEKQKRNQETAIPMWILMMHDVWVKGGADTHEVDLPREMDLDPTTADHRVNQCPAHHKAG